MPYNYVCDEFSSNRANLIFPLYSQSVCMHLDYSTTFNGQPLLKQQVQVDALNSTLIMIIRMPCTEYTHPNSIYLQLFLYTFHSILGIPFKGCHGYQKDCALTIVSIFLLCK